MSRRTNTGTKLSCSLEEVTGDGIRKETRYSEDEGDDHPCDIYSWSTGSEQRSVGMRKRREAVEKKSSGTDTATVWHKRRTEVRRRPDGLSPVCANKPKWTANKYASTSKSERPYAWSWSVHVRRGTPRGWEEGESRNARGAEYVGDLGTLMELVWPRLAEKEFATFHYSPPSFLSLLRLVLLLLSFPLSFETANSELCIAKKASMASRSCHVLFVRFYLYSFPALTDLSFWSLNPNIMHLPIIINLTIINERIRGFLFMYVWKYIVCRFTYMYVW